jgi:hypothetical protein
MFIQLSDAVNARETCAMQPQGVVRICAIEARNLMKMDVCQINISLCDVYNLDQKIMIYVFNS